MPHNLYQTVPQQKTDSRSASQAAANSLEVFESLAEGQFHPSFSYRTMTLTYQTQNWLLLLWISDDLKRSASATLIAIIAMTPLYKVFRQRPNALKKLISAPSESEPSITGLSKRCSGGTSLGYSIWSSKVILSKRGCTPKIRSRSLADLQGHPVNPGEVFDACQQIAYSRGFKTGYTAWLNMEQ